MIRRLPALALLASLVFAAAGVSLAQRGTLPERTTEGSYQGTWMYVDRVSRLALWFEEKRGRIRSVRYRYFYNDGSYGYTTDKGSGPSRSGMIPGTVELSWKHDRDEDVVRGRIVRSWGGQGVDASTTSDFELWRIEGGEKLFCRFTNGTRELSEAGETERKPVPDLTLKFNRMTDELVHWEELLY